ncbi:MAG: LPS assembly lipoprotein LptE [Verrucomicrobiales bacterium]|nr:LPS assembly lipoprotein LptE [Verrucomicrobiales bacterium]
MSRLFTTSLLFCFALVGLTGCAGYQLGDVKPSSYEGINNLHVPSFKNLTLEPRLSSLVTNAVLKELHVDGTYKITNRANCDAVLVGKIREIKKSQLRSQRDDTLTSKELRLNLYVDFHLEDPVSGKVIRDTTANSAAQLGKSKMTNPEETILARQGYVVGETIQYVDPSFQVSERSALSVAAQDAAEKMVSRIANGF